MINHKTHSGGRIFHESPPYSPFGTAFRKNVDKSQYYSGDEFIPVALNDPKTAFFQQVNNIRSSKEYFKCQVKSIYLVKNV